MAVDGKGIIEWPDPDLDFWPMSDLSSLNLSWLDQVELQGAVEGPQPHEKPSENGQRKAETRIGREVAARVSLSAEEQNPYLSLENVSLGIPRLCIDQSF